MNKGLIAAIFAVILLVGGAVAYVSLSGDDNTSNESTSSTSPAPSDPEAITEPPRPPVPASPTSEASAVTITYSKDGFSPTAATVKAGSPVKVINNSDEDLQFASDPHPEHTENDELNVGVIAAGQNKTFTPATAGTFGFHNHFADEHKGTLIVE